MSTIHQQLKRENDLDTIKNVRIPNILERAKKILTARSYLENLPTESNYDICREIVGHLAEEYGLYSFSPTSGSCENLKLVTLYKFDFKELLGYELKPEYKLLPPQSTNISLSGLLALLYIVKTRNVSELDVLNHWIVYPVGGVCEYNSEGLLNKTDAHTRWRNPNRYEYVSHCIDVLQHFMDTNEILGIKEVCNYVGFDK